MCVRRAVAQSAAHLRAVLPGVGQARDVLLYSLAMFSFTHVHTEQPTGH